MIDETAIGAISRRASHCAAKSGGIGTGHGGEQDGEPEAVAGAQCGGAIERPRRLGCGLAGGWFGAGVLTRHTLTIARVPGQFGAAAAGPERAATSSRLLIFSPK